MVYLIIFLLVIVVFEDFKWRAIHWFLPLLIFVASMVHVNWGFVQAGLNIALIIFQFAVLAGYVLIKDRKMSLFRSYIGTGDLVFFIAVSPLFGLPLFVYFLFCCYVFSLICHGIYLLINPNIASIPLAGYSSIVAVVFVLFGSNQYVQSLFNTFFI